MVRWTLYDTLFVYRDSPGVPQCTVIYAGFDLPATRSELPRLLVDDTAVDHKALHTQIGSNQLRDNPPIAIVIGGGYDDESFHKLDDAIVEAFKKSSKQLLDYAYFRADNELTDRLFAEGKGPQKRTPAYGPAITKRLKTKLNEVLQNGMPERSDRREPILY